jgi:hypothetical protein
MGHENFDHGRRHDGPSNRAFGFVFAGCFGLVWLWAAVFGNGGSTWALAASATFLAFALAVPGILGPFNRAWTRFGLLLHKIVSPVVLGIMFFGVITPIGLLMRALGKDPLRLQRSPRSGTYWIERVPPGPAPDSLKHLF